MKVKYCLFVILLGAAVVLAIACRQQTKEEPLLLLDSDDSTKEYGPPNGPVADNSRCYVCHINYEDEELAVVHALANIGCADCHGQCDEHIADESWAWGENGTPPDIMYPTERINSSCKGCHPTAKLGRGKKYCTDCHGDHRLAQRKCKWK